MRRIPMAVLVAVGLAVASWLALARVEAASQGCAVTYTVQRGDTLREIALQANTTVGRLARINSIKNPDRIYIGQVLCLPRFALQPHPRFDLVAEYTLDPGNGNANDWALGRSGIAGKRMSYPLLLAAATSRFSETVRLQQASVNAAPLLWLVPTTHDPPDYVLVAIGAPDPLLGLRIGVAPTLEELFPPNAGTCPPSVRVDRLLVDDESTNIRLKAELVGENDNFIVAPISAINYFKTAQEAQSCYNKAGTSFALHPTADPDVEGYKLLAVLTNRGIGPPPEAEADETCASWNTGEGWWSDFWRSYYC
jgi:LysM repeat protein